MGQAELPVAELTQLSLRSPVTRFDLATWAHHGTRLALVFGIVGATHRMAAAELVPRRTRDEAGPPEGVLGDLVRDPATAWTVPASQLPNLLAEVERLRVILWLRVNATERNSLAGGPASTRDAPEEGRSLTPQEAASIAGVSVRWLYRHAGELPFARRLTRKTLRISEGGLRRWLAGRRA